jgi:hypothetical protein
MEKAKVKKSDKLKTLAEMEGFDLESGTDLDRILLDSVQPGICMNPDCDYTTNVEPDQNRGYCEVCKTQTVASISMLMGII